MFIPVLRNQTNQPHFGAATRELTSSIEYWELIVKWVLWKIICQDYGQDKREYCSKKDKSVKRKIGTGTSKKIGCVVSKIEIWKEDVDRVG